ncbi:MAG: MOSC domain-containing protein, partial [Campylobacterales bacterium]|nr:MOSC domain-containing protein [Campylobacterales bacterium]
MKLLSIQTGIKKEYKKEEKTFESSYVKTKALLPQHIGAEGFEKDTQTDKRYHGGETKAIMVYSVDNYKFFQESLDLEKLSNGVFGENFSVTGLNESNVNIGDKFTIGEVIVEVSQPREPCWKVSYFLGHPDGAKAMYNSGKTG